LTPENTSIKKAVSQKLRMMLEEINQTFGHAKEVVIATYNQAILEGFLPFEAKDLIFMNVKNISRRTIYYYLPDACKDKHMQQVALHKRPVQFCIENSTAKKIEEDNASSAFMEEFRGKLNSRELSPKILEFSEMLEEKDNIINKKEKENFELKKVIELTENSHSNWLILRDDQAQKIHSIVARDKEIGSNSEFALEHDGHHVTNINDLDAL
jgi:hypothetical protein